MTDTNNDVVTFYDAMAADYHLIFGDWAQAVQWQGGIVHRLIRSQLTRESLTVLDAACGIGTQAIGLAQHEGYTIHATDISPQSVARARTEAQQVGVHVTFGVADMRTLDQQIDGTFDVVMAFDNAVPHLLTDDDLLAAARAVYRKTAPDGIFIGSIRDYDTLILERPEAMAHRVIKSDAGKRIVFQIWDWNHEVYTVTQFFVLPDNDKWTMRYHTTRYRALRRSEWTEILKQAGFTAVRWLMPSRGEYYQPVFIAER